MRLFKERPWYAEANEQRLVFAGLFAIAAIAAANAVLLLDVGLAFLYLVPLTLAAAFFSRWQIVAISFICALFAEGLSREPIAVDRILRAIVMFGSYTFIGFVVRSLVVNRRAAIRRLDEVEGELSRQHEMDVRSQQLLNSAPVGVLGLSAEGTIVSCNREAHEILAVGLGCLVGKSISAFLPCSEQTGSGPRGYTIKKATGDQTEVQVWSSPIAADDQMHRVIVISRE